MAQGRCVMKKKTPWFRKERLPRQLAHADLTDAMGRVQQNRSDEAAPAPPSPPVPLHVHNPQGGTRYHVLDPDTGKPVCGASGAMWAQGDGNLGPCGLCPGILAQRQAAAREGAT
jgi:hypothetical protein